MRSRLARANPPCSWPVGGRCLHNGAAQCLSVLLDLCTELALNPGRCRVALSEQMNRSRKRQPESLNNAMGDMSRCGTLPPPSSSHTVACIRSEAWLAAGPACVLSDGLVGCALLAGVQADAGTVQ